MKKVLSFSIATLMLSLPALSSSGRGQTNKTDPSTSGNASPSDLREEETESQNDSAAAYERQTHQQ